MECTPDIVVVKLKASFFNLDKDTNLINVYDSPINGSYKKRMKMMSTDELVTTLEHLQEVAAGIPINEDIILLGDFNARTGKINDILPPDSRLNEDQSEIYDGITLPERNNSDQKLNTNGRPFIELVQTLGLCILNGRTLGDVFGAPTCIQRGGVSTVDYVCTAPSLYRKVRDFRVLGTTHYSDHKPLSLTLNSTQTANTKHLDGMTEGLAPAPAPFKWIRSEDPSQDTSTLFQAAQKCQTFENNIADLLDRKINSVDEAIKLNKDVVTILTNAAATVTTKKSGKCPNKKKWYDNECRTAKRVLNKIERKVDSHPHDQHTRDELSYHSKSYRKTKRRKKHSFLYEMNEKIIGTNGIDWNALKQLSEQNKEADQFDLYDLILFHKFFNELYNKNCAKTAGHTSENVYTEEAKHALHEQVDTLNRTFTPQELDITIKKLRNNKSVSEDLISNEMLKNLSGKSEKLLLKLFNECLQQSVYPWNNSITTPLHKKGDRQNPDNYRAITVGSCLGKLFSSLLLARLLNFRETMCPDYPNQLGFRSGAQCSDHILTLNTIIEKYVRLGKKRLFVCFVDYRKAFDTVCRDALLFKLKEIGIAGNFFQCINYMYNHSSTRIKLIRKLSAAIDVTVGTEQGHPMSPELFKLFIHDLSTKIEEIDELNSPLLNGFKVSHLLWADDLVLLALDEASLQKLLDCLNNYADSWELSVNISKTNVMVFSTSSRILKCAHGFKLGDLTITPARTYCYLGILFSLNGSFKHAIDTLRRKALRSFFSLRRTLDTRALTTRTMLKLVDSLVKPVATYSCAVWLPTTNVIKAIMSKNPDVTMPKAAAKDALETTHLKILKWVLGVHKRTNNNFCYGDTGRYPWTLSVIPQCINYFVRASQASEGTVNTLLYHSFQEQKELNLTWFKTWSEILKADISALPPLSMSPTLAASEHLRMTFVSHWEAELRKQPKMAFYYGVKQVFGEEIYLNLPTRSHRVNIAKLRSSSHDLRIERGRYSKETGNIYKLRKACHFCFDVDSLEGLAALPFCEEPILETEEHAFTECPQYHQLRSNLTENLKSLILLKECGAIMLSDHLPEFGKFLTDCHRIRSSSKSPA